MHFLCKLFRGPIFETASTGPIQGDRFGSAAKDYADHRKGFPDATFDKLQKLGVGESGQSLWILGVELELWLVDLLTEDVL